MSTVQELITKDEILSCFPILKQLRTDLEESRFLKLIEEMRPGGYRLFALYNNGQMRSLVGFGKATNLYYGRHVWVYELVTDEPYRTRGYGSELMLFVLNWAKQNKCESVVLSSGLARNAAHSFYTDIVGAQKVSLVFQKMLS